MHYVASLKTNYHNLNIKMIATEHLELQQTGRLWQTRFFFSVKFEKVYIYNLFFFIRWVNKTMSYIQVRI